MTPLQQARLDIERDAIDAIANWMYQHQKGNRTCRLSHLRDDAERAVFIADAMELLSAERRHERAIRLNALRSQGFAIVEDEQIALDHEARQDVAAFGDPVIQAFMTTSPKHCAICKHALIANAVDVLLTENLKGKAHGLCCAKDEARFEFINEFTYKLLEAK